MNFSYRWVIVGVGALMTCVGIGAMFSLAVYLEPMSTETGWSRAGISGAMTIDFLTMGIAGFAWGAANDRFGTRPVVLSGALLLAVGLLAWTLLIPAALLVRQPPESAPSGLPAMNVLGASGAGWSVARALRSPQFLVLALTFFACCAAHSGPIFHMVSYAMLCGIP